MMKATTTSSLKIKKYIESILENAAKNDNYAADLENHPSIYFDRVDFSRKTREILVRELNKIGYKCHVDVYHCPTTHYWQGDTRMCSRASVRSRIVF